MKVRVLAPDLKLLGSKGKYIYPKVGDIVSIDNSSVDLEMDIGNVERASNDDKRTKNVKEQKPSKTARIPEKVSKGPEEADEEEEPKKKKPVVVMKETKRSTSKKRKVSA